MIGPPTSNKMTMEMYFFEALPEQICLKLTHNVQWYGPNKLWNSEANPFRQSFEKKYISMVILFDVGGLIMADNTSREEGFQILMYFVHYNHFSRLQIDWKIGRNT